MPLYYFLGIEVARNAKGLFLCKRKYALEIVDVCGLLWAKSVDFSMKTNHKLGLATSKLLSDPTHYRRLVERLIYLTFTRSELSYSIHILPKFM